MVAGMDPICVIGGTDMREAPVMHANALDVECVVGNGEVVKEGGRLVGDGVGEVERGVGGECPGFEGELER